jgi:hypothetical protein
MTPKFKVGQVVRVLRPSLLLMRRLIVRKDGSRREGQTGVIVSVIHGGACPHYRVRFFDSAYCDYGLPETHLERVDV